MWPVCRPTATFFLSVILLITFSSHVVFGQWAIGFYYADLPCMTNTTRSIYMRLGCVKTINAFQIHYEKRECNTTHYIARQCGNDNTCSDCNSNTEVVAALYTCENAMSWECGMPNLDTNPTSRDPPFVYKAIRPSPDCTDQANDVWALTEQDDCFLIPPESNNILFTYRCDGHGNMVRLECHDSTYTCAHNCTATTVIEDVACVDTSTPWKDYTTFTCSLDIALNASYPYLAPDAQPHSPPSPSAAPAPTPTSTPPSPLTSPSPKATLPPGDQTPNSASYYVLSLSLPLALVALSVVIC